jgi:hypothetical protein
MPILETRKLEKLLKTLPRAEKKPEIIEEEEIEEDKEDYEFLNEGSKSRGSKGYYTFNETYASFGDSDL